jgi:hypothetical protein
MRHLFSKSALFRASHNVLLFLFLTTTMTTVLWEPEKPRRDNFFSKKELFFVSLFQKKEKCPSKKK